MVTKNCVNLNTAFSLAVNGYHKIPPTQGRAWVSSALSGAGPDSAASRLSKTVPKVEKPIKQPPYYLGPGENVSPQSGPPLATVNTFQVLPVRLPHGTPYLKLLKNVSTLIITATPTVGGKQRLIRSRAIPHKTYSKPTVLKV